MMKTTLEAPAGALAVFLTATTGAVDFFLAAKAEPVFPSARARTRAKRGAVEEEQITGRKRAWTVGIAKR